MVRHSELKIRYDPEIGRYVKKHVYTGDHNGIVNSIHSLIKNFDIKLNGKKVYDCNDANHSVNIKNLLEYSPSYASSTGTNEFYHLDTFRAAEERPAQAAYNKGYAERKTILGTSSIVTRELPLNRYSFF